MAAAGIRADAIVVGAGISGLCAAIALRARGMDVALVEARRRPGGRTLRARSDRGAIYEGAAQFVKAGHSAAWELIRRYGLETAAAGHEGLDVYSYGGVRGDEHGAFSSEPHRAASFVALCREFADLAGSMPTGGMLAHREAAELDRTTVRSWARARTEDPAVLDRFLRDTTFGMGSTGGPVSLLAALHYANAAGRSDSGHEHLLSHGFSDLVDALVGELSTPILAGREVTAIERVGDGLDVITPDERLRGQVVVLAMSPPLIRRLRLPEDVAWAPLHGWRQECAVKAQLRYAEPFWTERGLSGNAAGDRAVTYVVNTSSEDRQLLTALWNAGRHELAPAALRERILSDIAAYFGGDVPAPVDIAITDWSADPFAGGCGSPLPPGVLTSGDPFAVTLAPGIIRAGTEASPVGWGSVEGAIRAGRAAAAAVQLTR